jgi:hypothetical protein
MTSRKDIVLIALGGLLSAAGLVFYFNPTAVLPVMPVVPDAENRDAVIRKRWIVAPSGAAYPGTPRASLEDNVKDWLSPQEDEDNWDYDLFTSIDVVWDPAIKEYVPRSRKPDELPPFGITLVSVGHPVYPYILSHTTMGPGRKEEDRLISLKNVKTKKYLDDCKLNTPIPGVPNLLLKSYEVVRGKDADGIPFVRNVLTVADPQFGVVEIDDEKPLEFKDRIEIVLGSATDPAWRLTLVAGNKPGVAPTFKAGGDRFTYNGATYVVKGIDLAAKSVSFDKTFALNPKKPKKLASDPKTLVVPAPAAPVPKSKPGSPAAPKKTP